MVHYPGRVDTMALKEFKEMSGIDETPYPNAIGPLVDAVVRQVVGLQDSCFVSDVQLKRYTFFLFFTGLPNAVSASPSLISHAKQVGWGLKNECLNALNAPRVAP